MEIEINYLAVLLAMVASMVVGFIWYSPALFGKKWAALHGMDAEKMKASQKEAGKAYVISAIFSIVTAYVLAHVVGLSQAFYHYSDLSTGLSTAFWMWLGFVMPVQATATLFSDKKQWALFGIDTCYQLVAMLAMGKVIGLM